MGQRINNWQIAFQKAIDKERTFNWGTSDCIMFSLDCIADYTDNTLAKKHKGTYTKLFGAIKTLKKLGAKGKTLNEIMLDFLDKRFERININFAQRGDIVGFNSEEISEYNDMKDSGFTVGIMCDGYGRFVMRNGYQDINREYLTTAWKV